jgi:hypothetical protein
VPIFSYASTGDSLSNGGEAVELSRPGEPEPPGSEMPGFVPYYRVDFVEYDDVPPWSTPPDGDGPSLVRMAPLLFGNDPASWTTGVVGGSPGRGDADLTGPQVVDVRVGGSSWELGDVAIPTGGAQQFRPLPWRGIDRLTIAFSEPVVMDAFALDIDAENESYTFASNVAPGAAATAVTWTISPPVAADALTLDLESERVRDLAGNPLDGEWTNGSATYPSGDGASGGDFVFTFRVLPGDANQDAVVDGADRFLVRQRQFSTPDHVEYIATADIDRDGRIAVYDLVLVRNHSGQTAPSPSAAAAAPVAAFPAAQPAPTPAASPMTLPSSARRVVSPVRSHSLTALARDEAVVRLTATRAGVVAARRARARLAVPNVIQAAAE